jgi:hypothetical protein
MRLCIRLAVLAALLVALAIGLVALRTETHQAGYRLHALFRDKRQLEKECCRLEVVIARLKSQDRLHEHVADLEADPAADPAGPEGDTPPGSLPPRPRTRLTNGALPGPP